MTLIVGMTGKDSAYLAESLLKKSYAVHDIRRRASLFNTERIDHLYQESHETGHYLIRTLRRHDRLARADAHDREGPTRRGLQPRRAKPRRADLNVAEHDALVRRHGYAAPDRHERVVP